MNGNNWKSKVLVIFKLGLMGTIILFVAWLLRGHDVLTGIALGVLAIWVAAKIVVAVIYRRRGGFGGYPPGAPMATPPVRPKPPELTGALKG